LIDKKPEALEAALREIESFKATVGNKTGHQGGSVMVSGLDGLDHGLNDAWLAVEVCKDSGKNIQRLTKNYNRTFLNRWTSSVQLSSSSMKCRMQIQS
jgi:ethanolamine ammonia-lyase large subunit